MEKNVKISMLNEIYGKLLTQKQNEIIEDYYNNDLTLSEIAQNNKITRQAVRDILKKGENKLLEYEEKLKYMKKAIEQKKKTEKIIQKIARIQEKNEEKEITKKLENIKTELNKLV